MKKFFSIIFTFVFLFSIFPPCDFTAYGQQEVLKLVMGEGVILPVNNPKRIIIGNPEIIDVVYASKKEVNITPKAIGSTSLVIWDNYGEQSFEVRVFGEDIEKIKERVDSLLKSLELDDVYTKADENEGKVFLLGEIAGSQRREMIFTALGVLKEKIVDLTKLKEEEAVVEIDVQVLELDRDATSTLGFSWPGDVSIGSAATSGKWSNIWKVDTLTRTAFTWSLEALIQEGKAKILSRPRLSCQSGKEAELMVGGERPILTTQAVSSSGSTSTSVDYKEYGIKLNIRPVVTDDNRIKLALNMEVSEIGDAIVIGSALEPTAKAWPLTKRNASTELILDDQQTLAIGGLIKKKTEEDYRRTPFFSDIPIIGMFFRRKETKIGQGAGQRGDNELFITLTPTIVSGKNPIKDKPAKEDASDQMSKSLKQMSQDPVATYAEIVQNRILENLSYPDSARQAGFQGIIKLSLLLSYQGEILDVQVKESSGYREIDKEVISMVKAISPYPPFPPSVESNELWIDIPINYKLN